MATILLSAAGAAAGGAVGGTVAGLSSVAIGRAMGATLGQAIDQRLLGQGSEPVETGRVDRFRLTGTGDGEPIARVFGRMRVGGQVIWASDFLETTSTSGGGGKGSPSEPEVTTYNYSVSLAVALCEGEVSAVGRVWADGEQVSREDLNMRVYTGSMDQLPDPVIEAIEGRGNVPAYRGTAYVVLENIALGPYGNRVPQFSFEVVRPEQSGSSSYAQDFPQLIKGVALMPGTGEYALAKSAVHYTKGWGRSWAANSNSLSGRSDFVTSMEMLRDELPACGAASLVVSWFGDDLRCGRCQIKPKIERANIDGANMAWGVAGLNRSTAEEIARENDRPIYGGTPADAAVVQAIRHMKDTGQRVMFYPFILMEQQKQNRLTDPWTGAPDQPAMPWRGRITLSEAPGTAGSPDGTAAADAQVARFFGAARASDFQVHNGRVQYAGPDDWGLRRFILHYAALCKAAGGVAAFCISSEMRGLTQIRGATGFPAVAALRDLAADVRRLLGAETRIGYAADWSEYFGYQPQDGSGDRYFHLDPLWADENIDFVGVDNYMPLSDWRDGSDHADAGWGSIYNPDYLAANIEGGEGFDWYYRSPEDEAAQIRTPIQDQEHDEPWVWRFKDLRNWWGQQHHERIGGARLATPTAWVPRSKPFWFTELGCAAVDKGTNQPNRFLDPKSSESGLPRASNGLRDDFLQRQYLKTLLSYWADTDRNPISEVYGAPMIDLENAFVWAWDTRPFPVFPNNRTQWSDGANYARGHWINGRVGARTLASVVEEICSNSGIDNIDTDQLFGVVHGYAQEDVADARTALQPLMLRFGFDTIERDGVLRFVTRTGAGARVLQRDELAECAELDGLLELNREADAEMTGRVRVRFIQAGADHDIAAEEAVLPDTATHAVAASDLPLAMTRAEGRQAAERWLAEARVSRDKARFALPPSRIDLGAGDIVELPVTPDDGRALYRIDRIEQSELQIVEAVRIEPSVYVPSEMIEDVPGTKTFMPALPVFSVFLDLPLMSGDEVSHAPHLAVSATPWPGSIALYASASDDTYALSQVLSERAVIGVTETPLRAAAPGVWDRGAGLRVQLLSGALESREAAAILNGANLAAIGDGSTGNWELFQFQNAELVATDTYELSTRLRGQLGSDALMPQVWPVGSHFVLLNNALAQVKMSSAQRRIARHYRIGPAQRGYDDPAYTHLVAAHDGNGLRPYAPCHLSLATGPGGDFELRWIRRTRIEGDSWDLADVPLGEDSEAYLVRVQQGTAVLRETTVTEPGWTYSAAMQAADDLTLPARIEVAQISARYGSGAFAGIDVGP